MAAYNMIVRKMSNEVKRSVQVNENDLIYMKVRVLYKQGVVMYEQQREHSEEPL
jgi:hypothetical protein